MPWNFFLIYVGSVMYFMSYSLEARRPSAAPRRARGAGAGALARRSAARGRFLAASRAGCARAAPCRQRVACTPRCLLCGP